MPTHAPKTALFVSTILAAALTVLMTAGAAATVDPTDTLPIPEQGQRFTGSMEFRLLTDPPPAFGEVSTLADGTRVMRNAWFETYWDSSDDRFQGGGEYAGESVTYTSDASEHTRVLWMSLVLENDGGTWTSRPDTMGVWADGLVIPVWFEGSGGYEGLSAFVLNTVEEYDDGHASLQYEGWILPDSPTS